MDIGISDIALSSSIPNRIVVDSLNDGDRFTVEVGIDGSTVYSTTLYGSDSRALFYNLGDIVSDHMRAHRLTLARLTVRAFFDNGSDSAECWVVFADIRTAYASDSDFLRSQFLSSRRVQVVPRSASLRAAFVINGQDQESPTGLLSVAFRRRDGSVGTDNIGVSLTDERETHLYEFAFSEADISGLVGESQGTEGLTVMGGSLVVGRRSVEFYFVDDRPVDRFAFVNAFNIREDYHALGARTVKTVTDRKEGVASGITSYYDQSTERTVGIVTVPLSLEEASWLNEFLTSPYVSMAVTADNDQEVLLSDIESEIAESGKDQVVVKFAWRFADGKVWRVYEEGVRVFDAEYNTKFK